MNRILENPFIKEFFRFLFILDRHNIFILSSSLAYYATLALAPFLLILFQLAPLIGLDNQRRLIRQISYTISPQVADVVNLIVDNADKAIDTSSLVGIIGIVLILFTSSVAFLHLRYSFNLIYGFYDPERQRPLMDIIKDRLISMVFVVLFNIGFVASLFLTSYFFFHMRTRGITGLGASLMLTSFNFFVFFGLFFCLYCFVPSKRVSWSVLIRSSAYASVGFLVGKILFGIYFKNIVSTSVYGAAGALLVFLIWTYYSALIVFFSAELANYLKMRKS